MDWAAFVVSGKKSRSRFFNYAAITIMTPNETVNIRSIRLIKLIYRMHLNSTLSRPLH